MALPHKEWRAYLDTILDSYMRTNVTIDAVGYMVDRMEEIFSEHLEAVPEYPPNSIYPLNLDPLQAFLTHSAVRGAVPPVPPGATGVEEKWVVKREIMDYIKSILEMSALKSMKIGPKRRTLPSVKCWVSEDDAIKLTYMEPAVLTRFAKAETPLQANSTQNVPTLKCKTAAAPSNRLAVPNHPNINHTRLPSKKRDPFFTSFPGKGLVLVPVEQETLSEEEADKLLIPKLSIPRMAMEGVWTCVKGTPFSSGLKNTVTNGAQLRSEHTMLGMDDDGPTTDSVLPGRMSPPLFPRNADSQRRGSDKVHVEANGIEAVKDILKPAFVDMDVEMQEKEDIMERMRIVEGWPSIPLDLGSSSTPPMTADKSQGGDEDVLQIDELMLPSSPPFDNKELKELFRSRMDQILLPRREYPLARLGEPQSTIAIGQTSDQTSFSTTIREILQVPITKSPGIVPRAQEGFSKTAIQETPDLGSEVGGILDELCKSVKDLDKYSAITKDTIEEKDGMFLPVPSLPPPSQGLVIPKLLDVVQLTKSFDVIPLSDVLISLDIVTPPAASVTLVEPANGVTKLKLELSWQPFVYRGPVISHETLCEVNQSPFSTPKDHLDDVVTKRHTAIMQKAKQLVADLERTHGAKGKDPSMILGDRNDKSAGRFSSRVLGNVWSSDGLLLLTRAELQRAKRLSVSQDASGSHQELPRMGGCGVGGASGLINLKPKSESTVTGEFSGNAEGMTLDDGPPLDDRPRFKFQSNSHPSRDSRAEPQPPVYSQNSASAVDIDGHWPVESGSSHGYESAIGATRTPIENNFSSFQPTEKTAPLADDDMGIDSFDAPPIQFNYTPFNGNHMDTSSPLQASQIPHYPTPFSNVGLLQDFLAHRAATGYLYANHQADGPPVLVETAQIPDESFGAQPGEPSADTEWLTLPPELLSETIVIPEQWNIPNSRHRYLASLPFLQRRALVQKLEEDCSVDLSEVHDAIEADIIVDSHSAVKFITVSEVVPSNLDALTSSIIELGYGFTRILIVLEAYPFSRSTLSAQKLESTHWDELKLITNTVISTFTKLRRTVIIGMGMLEVTNDQGEAEDLGPVRLEFVLSWSPDETVRLVRRMGDYAESVVSDDERGHLWGPRLWLESFEDVEDALKYGEYRGMNLFAALSVASVMSLSEFVGLPLQRKLHLFGTLVGKPRMILFHQEAEKQITNRA